MTTVLIPTDFGQPAFTVTVAMDGVFFELEFRINRRDGRWRLAMSRGGTLLVAGISVVTGRDLIKQFKADSRMPQGVLIAIDTEGNDTDPTEDGFGSLQVLTYESAV